MNASLIVCDVEINEHGLKILNTRKMIEYENIVGAIFSDNGERIYYTKANALRAYSPIGRVAPHEFDIFSLKLPNKEKSKVTSLDAYSIESLCEFDETRLLARVLSGRTKNGTNESTETGNFLIDKQTGDLVQLLFPKNDPEQNTIFGSNCDLFENPNYSKNSGSIVFSGPRTLYVMPLSNTIATPIFNSRDIGQIIGIKIFNVTNQILFRLEYTRNLFRIRYDGTGLEEIKISENLAAQ